MNSFNYFKIDDKIVKSIDALGFKEPTEVQSQVIPQIINHKDVIVKSETGSGKTAAFAIPICELVDWDENKPQALVLVPTRELAVQVKEDISNIGKFNRIRAVAVFGKQPFSNQERELKQKVHVAIGTPGRVLDHIKRGTLPLEKIKYLVIDEADEMFNMGFIDQVQDIVNTLPKDRVTMLFSATLNEEVENLCNTHMKKPIRIEINLDKITTENIEHYYFEVKEEEKFSLLRDITTVENPDSCLIFCGTKEKVDKVFNKLNRNIYPCNKIHGGMMQEDRLAVMKKFKRGEFKYLVATDVAARGIDIDNINVVINYDIPLEKESYVHRIGRTGRAGKSGKAITLVTPYQKRFLSQIEEYVGFQITKIDVPTKEEIRAKKPEFEKKIKEKIKIKTSKAEMLNKDITKLYFNGGKKKKIRAGDFVGTIANIEGVNSEDIGVIDIQENISYVDILNGKGNRVLAALKDATIKGKKLKVQKANK